MGLGGDPGALLGIPLLRIHTQVLLVHISDPLSARWLPHSAQELHIWKGEWSVLSTCEAKVFGKRKSWFWSSGCCGCGRACPDVVPLLSPFHLDGPRGFPLRLPGPPRGLEASRAALQAVQFTWFSFISASGSAGPALLAPSSRAVRWTMRFTSNKILGGGSLQERIPQALAPRSERRPPCQVPADTEDRFPVRIPHARSPAFLPGSFHLPFLRGAA